MSSFYEKQQATQKRLEEAGGGVRRLGDPLDTVRANLEQRRAAEGAEKRVDMSDPKRFDTGVCEKCGEKMPQPKWVAYGHYVASHTCAVPPPAEAA